MTKLQELLARVEACHERGNFQLECDLGAALGTHPNEKRGTLNLQTTPPPFTRSVDAALSLVEAKLPDYGWFLRRDDTDASGKRAAPIYNASLLYPDALRVCASFEQAPTPALALLAAMLRALIAQDAHKENGNG